VSYYSEGIHACICNIRLGSNPALAGIKHLNRLEQVLARNELDDGCQEGLMLDGEGRVVEGTMSNIFLISDGALITPAIESSGVRGVARDRLIRWAKQHGVDCQEKTELGLEQVFSANALLVCNSVIGVWPVQQLEHVTYPLDNELLVKIMNRFPAICD
jgi:4-amino-4-deoxychorismate lyase